MVYKILILAISIPERQMRNDSRLCAIPRIRLLLLLFLLLNTAAWALWPHEAFPGHSSTENARGDEGTEKP
ncbi:MAG TPA: hypothetical protein VLB09_02700, partial [Nitrospiria bacterium]|nr:hypothetical protein [Nitrospiria bacterium]